MVQQYEEPIFESFKILNSYDNKTGRDTKVVTLLNLLLIDKNSDILHKYWFGLR